MAIQSELRELAEQEQLVAARRSELEAEQAEAVARQWEDIVAARRSDVPTRLLSEVSAVKHTTLWRTLQKHLADGS